MKQYSLGNQLSFEQITPGFPVIKINNRYATAMISLYGGQLLEYKPHDQNEQVIWLSEQAIFKHNKAIRGGIPICWPWFGGFDSHSIPNELPAHGFARIVVWDVESTQILPDGGTEVILKMPCEEVCSQFKTVFTHFDCELIFKITIADSLKVELTSINHSQHEMVMSNALHSYFKISDIRNITIQGLENTIFQDKLKQGQSDCQKTALKFDAETDKVFINTSNNVELTDPGFDRRIVITKENSNSTVIWNPWKEKSALMSDMSDQAWLEMVCIEPANVLKNQLLLAPGDTHSISTSIFVK